MEPIILKLDTSFLRGCCDSCRMLVGFLITCSGKVYSLQHDVIKFVSATGRWFSPGTPVSSTNKTDCHYLTEILLKVALSTIKPINCIFYTMTSCFSFIYSYTVIITRFTEVYS